MRGNVKIPRTIPTLTLPVSQVAMTPDSLIQRIPIEYSGDGAIEAFPNNDNVAVRVDGHTLELTACNTGASQITVRSSSGVNSKRHGGGSHKCSVSERTAA